MTEPTIPMPTDAVSVKFVFAVIRERATMFAVAFAVLFTIIAIAQYLFVRHSVYRSAERQLQQWADEVAEEIDYKDRWDLKAYRQSEEVHAPHVFTFTSDGTVVETQGFIRGLVGRVRLADDTILAGPKTVTVPETGETWRQLAIKVKGGIVALGILDPQDVMAPDGFLTVAAQEFGSTIEEAINVRTRQVANQVDYAIIDDSGNLLFEADWFPVKVEAASLAELTMSRGLIKRQGQSYLVYAKPIQDATGNTVGTIVIPKDVSDEERVIRQHIVFNAGATLACWLAALGVVILYLGLEDWRNRPRAVSLEDALRNGESQMVEFKAGHAEVPLQRAIVAFANTNSGTIFLGVDDKGEVLGIDCDSTKKKDEELQRIRNITAQSIRPPVSVRADFIRHDGKMVLRVFVPRGQQPLYFLNHEIYVREQTSSMKASPEHVEAILARFYGWHGPPRRSR